MTAPRRTADLVGKKVVVTGAGNGIGRGIAAVLGRDGARVLLVDRDARAVATAAEALRDEGLDAQHAVLDITDEAAVDSMADEARDVFGTIDGLVNNAGVVHVARFGEHTLADWERLTRVNLLGTFLCTKAFLPDMMSQGSGSIVNISSIAALGYTTSHAAYAATKAGILAMTRELAVETMASRVRANAILPGFIASELSASVAGSSASALADLPASSAPLYGRWGAPEDVGDLASFLIGDRSTFLTGASITLGGGSDVVLAGG